ncbi:hypothetical protein CTA2_4609, partial [Colletotrichum tanaceti]
RRRIELRESGGSILLSFSGHSIFASYRNSGRKSGQFGVLMTKKRGAVRKYCDINEMVTRRADVRFKGAPESSPGVCPHWSIGCGSVT